MKFRLDWRTTARNTKAVTFTNNHQVTAHWSRESWDFSTLFFLAQFQVLNAMENGLSLKILITGKAWIKSDWKDKKCF